MADDKNSGSGTWDGIERRKMARYLGPVDVLAIAFGCIIGWGAFVMPGTTFLPTAGPVGTVIAMAISAVIMIIIGMNYAFLMARRPQKGGVYSYTKEAFGRDHAFLCSWFLSLSYISIVFLNATALFIVVRTLFEDFLQIGFHYTVEGYEVYFGEVAVSTAALLMIGLLFMLHKPLLQMIQTALATGLLLGSVIITVFCVQRLDIEYIIRTSESGIDMIPVIFAIVLLSPWAFVGFDVIALETPHFKFPVKRSKWIIILSILLGGFVYAAMTLVSITCVPDGFGSWQEYISSLNELKGVAAVPTFFAAKSILGTPGLWIIGLTALCAIMTGIIGAYRATTRVLSTMAEDKIISKHFSSTTNCICFIMVISVAVSLLGRNALDWFVDLTTFGAIIGFGYTSASAWKIAKQEKVRRVMISAVLGTVITAAFAVVQLIPKLTGFETMRAEAFLLLAFWCLLGFMFYWRTMRRSGIDDYGGISTSSTALFSLLLYSSLMWFILKLIEHAGPGEMRNMVIRNGLVFMGLILTGLAVMLYVQSMLKERQTQLEREMIHAEESSKAKSQFLFSMSHDIRTPMNAIIGFTDLALRDDAGLEDKNRYLEKIKGSGSQLLSIINDVLDMSRIENRKMELHEEAMDLEKTASEMRDTFEPQMEQKNISFTVDTSGIRDKWVMCDRSLMSRIFLNLIGNAYKFTPEGGSITVRVSEEEKAGKTGDGRNSYVLSVKDTGIGMSEEFVASIFTPFERERTSTVSGIQGTGLGLSIVKGIVDLMGGETQVKTEQGKGSEFIITFSLLPAEPVEEKKEQVKDHSALNGVRVLLADDNEVNREIATMILTQAGMTVDTVENGKEAVDMLASEEPCKYDVVLMDIQMPVMNGYEATRTIRSMKDRSFADIPVIAMTANAFREDEIEAEKAGMQAHIAKPLDIEKMMDTLADVLSRKG